MSNFTTGNITLADRDVEDVVSIISICLASISLACGAVIFYMCVQRVLHITRDLLDMLACLIVCEMIMEIGIIIGNVVHFFTDLNGREDPCDTTMFCIIQGFYSSYFNIASLQWTIVLEAICLWAMATNVSSIELNCVVRRVLFFFCWTIPLIICVVAVLVGAFGERKTKTVSTYCWITSCDAILPPQQQLLWMFLSGKALEIVAYFSVTNCFFILFFFKRRKALKMAMSWAETDEKLFNNDDKAVASTSSRFSERSCLLSNSSEIPLDPAFRIFALIPLCYVATRAWGTVRFVFEISGVFGDITQQAGLVASEFFATIQAVGDGSLITIKFILILILRREAREFCISPFKRRRKDVKRGHNVTGSYQMLASSTLSSGTEL